MSCKNKGKLKQLICVFTALLLCCLSTIPAAAQSGNAQEKSATGRVVRVAYPPVSGFSEKDENGRYTGLVVDFLNEISKYTNWQYEYVEGDYMELHKALADGNLDLMGGMFYEPSYEEDFAYPEYNMGYNYGVLFGRQDDDSVRSYDIESINGKKIGVFEKAVSKIDRLKKFLDFNQVECELVYYTAEDMTNDNLYQHLINKDVDLLMGNDAEANGTFRVIAEFQAQHSISLPPRGMMRY